MKTKRPSAYEIDRIVIWKPYNILVEAVQYGIIKGKALFVDHPIFLN